MPIPMAGLLYVYGTDWFTMGEYASLRVYLMTYDAQEARQWLRDNIGNDAFRKQHLPYYDDAIELSVGDAGYTVSVSWGMFGGMIYGIACEQPPQMTNEWLYHTRFEPGVSLLVDPDHHFARLNDDDIEIVDVKPADADAF